MTRDQGKVLWPVKPPQDPPEGPFACLLRLLQRILKPWKMQGHYLKFTQIPESLPIGEVPRGADTAEIAMLEFAEARSKL